MNEVEKTISISDEFISFCKSNNFDHTKGVRQIFETAILKTWQKKYLEDLLKRWEVVLNEEKEEKLKLTLVEKLKIGFENEECKEELIWILAAMVDYDNIWQKDFEEKYSNTISQFRETFKDMNGEGESYTDMEVLRNAVDFIISVHIDY